MKLVEIVLAVMLPPLAVALREGTTPAQVFITFFLWLCGFFPGVIYALWIVTADNRQVRASTLASPGRRPSAAP